MKGAAALQNPVLLGLAAFLAAAGTVTFVLVQIGLMPQIVATGDLPRANARIELARALASAAFCLMETMVADPRPSREAEA